MAKYDVTILCEKPDASKNFAKALGGTEKSMTGTFDGKSYQIVASVGHIFQFVEPHEMVQEELADQYKSWDLETMPWNLNHLNWKRKPTKRDVLAKIKRAVVESDAVVIATDVDPSGEGQLIAWEILHAIRWKKDVYRMNFSDEAIPSLQKSFREMTKLPVMEKDGEYLKAEARSRFDFASMQLTRIATTSARNAGYQTVARQGRLKSVMVSHVYKQEEAIKNYVRKPYYEVKFKDSYGHVFGRKFTKDQLADESEMENVRFDTVALAENDKANYHEDEVVGAKRTRKTSAPSPLLDLSSLSSILAKKGFKAEQVLSTYQELYESQIVSYPRTEDKIITSEQFNEMLPLIDRIADVVGVDKRLLTHRTPRKTHVKEGGAHGANRPGKNVPQSLDDVYKKGGDCAVAIYELLAKNFLAMFGEDYVYDTITAHLKSYPNFVTSFSVPVEMNFKAIFDTANELKDEAGKKDEKAQLSKIATPFIYEGANKKPAKPTMTWLTNYLTKHDVGTGATQVSTLADITTGKGALLSENKGVLATTETGKVTALTAQGTFISNVGTTKQLFDYMAEVKSGKVSISQILDLLNQVIAHDKPKMIENAKNLYKVMGKPSKSIAGQEKEYVEGVWVKTNAKVKFNRVWNGHRFTDDEVKKLLNGSEITFKQKGTSGKGKTKKTYEYNVSGVLAENTFKGNTFIGFSKSVKNEGNK